MLVVLSVQCFVQLYTLVLMIKPTKQQNVHNILVPVFKFTLLLIRQKLFGLHFFQFQASLTVLNND